MLLFVRGLVGEGVKTSDGSLAIKWANAGVNESESALKLWRRCAEVGALLGRSEGVSALELW